MKQKILFILHLPPPVHGSSVVGKQIKDSKRIRKEFDCTFINLCTSSTIDSIGSMSINKFFRYFIIIFNIIKYLTFGKFDKVYLAPTVSNSGFYKDLIIIFVIKLFGISRVYHLHNKGVSKRNANLMINALYSFFFNEAKVILLSERIYKDVREFVDEKDVFICPNGINNEIEKIPIRNKSNTVKLLFLSNLIEAKGVFFLLKACDSLNKKGYSFECIFVGGEGDISKEDFESQVKLLKLEKCVFYLGRKYDDEKKQIYLNSDIFIFPTFYENETFGLVNIEAMMYGLPVISTNEGGIPDIIKDGVNGYIIDSDKDLVDKIKLLIENKELRTTLGKNGREIFLNKYTSSKFEESLIDILKNC